MRHCTFLIFNVQIYFASLFDEQNTQIRSLTSKHSFIQNVILKRAMQFYSWLRMVSSAYLHVLASCFDVRYEKTVRLLLNPACRGLCFNYFRSIYMYWCPTRFSCQMMFVSYNSNIMGTTSITGTVYPFGTPQCTSGFYWGSRYPIFSFLFSVLSSIVCLVCRLSFGYYPVWPSIDGI